jgi:Lsr2
MFRADLPGSPELIHSGPHSRTNMNNDLANLPADDLDGSVSDTVRTVSFEIDHVSYEINLTAENAEALRTKLAAFIAHARPVLAPRSGHDQGDATTEPSRRPWTEPSASSPIFVPAPAD